MNTDAILLAHPDDLNTVIDFDCPFTVTADGTVIADDRDAPSGPDGVVCEPDLAGLSICGLGWSPVTGYSGQYGYSGPVMHASEQLAGGMARDILATPGTYLVTCVYSEIDEDGNAEDPTAWILLRLDEDVMA